jgi:hypothetical protein
MGIRQPRDFAFHNQKGFAFVMVILAAAVMAILAGVVTVLMSYEVRHEKEMELLFRGEAYARAIGDYYMAGPAGKARRFPQRLEDLLDDPRFPRRRYLRNLYTEPFGAGWALVLSPDGGITGLASQCKDKPLKQIYFPPEFGNFVGSEHYSDWVFLYHLPPTGAGVASKGNGVSQGHGPL